MLGPCTPPPPPPPPAKLARPPDRDSILAFALIGYEQKRFLASICGYGVVARSHLTNTAFVEILAGKLLVV
jgi:hypothetical protein